ncbi:hypothetical protein [Microbulbifer sp. VAAF005]|uniref:hypothetical protein n=1 Tax=Microbulbifer sp. VAAF005 TaxID=3034230 RepID=UPI0024AC96C0|nr:hypothetical protein [Microbulbifer sp. VAAF005]WHI47175.1 hypothetical protein P0078_02025 [Microbulbifer sp. VAAF005]
MKKVLIPVTNHATLGETDQANGTYSPELTHAIHVFMESGLDYDIASIKGGKHHSMALTSKVTTSTKWCLMIQISKTVSITPSL